MTRRCTPSGRPRPGMGIAVRDADGRDLPAGRGRRGLPPLRRGDGGLLARPGGHAPRRCATAGCAPATSAVLDGAGCLALAGRSKEMYIRGGYNVYPMEVEAVLGEHPGVARGGGRPPARRRDGRGRRGRRRARGPVGTADARRPARLRRRSSRRLQAARGDRDRRRAAAHPGPQARPACARPGRRAPRAATGNEG